MNVNNNNKNENKPEWAVWCWVIHPRNLRFKICGLWREFRCVKCLLFHLLWNVSHIPRKNFVTQLRVLSQQHCKQKAEMDSKHHPASHKILHSRHDKWEFHSITLKSSLKGRRKNRTVRRQQKAFHFFSFLSDKFTFISSSFRDLTKINWVYRSALIGVAFSFRHHYENFIWT